MLCVWPRGVWPRDSVSFVMRPSVDCPWGPGLGGTAPRFQNGIRSNTAGGREGAGRGGGPASWAVLRWALASSCLCAASTAAAAAVSGCRRDGMPVAAACWAWERCFWYCCLPVPDQRPLASPFPGPSELLWQLRCGTGPWGWGTQGSWAVLCLDPIPPVLLLGAWLRFWAWQPLPHWAGTTRGSGYGSVFSRLGSPFQHPASLALLPSPSPTPMKWASRVWARGVPGSRLGRREARGGSCGSVGMGAKTLQTVHC